MHIYKTPKRKEKKMKAYYIKYLLDGFYSKEQGIDVLARNKADAYMKAVYELIPAKDGRSPFGAYVHSVTYSNGNYRVFNHSYGDAY